MKSFKIFTVVFKMSLRKVFSVASVCLETVANELLVSKYSFIGLSNISGLRQSEEDKVVHNEI